MPSRWQRACAWPGMGGVACGGCGGVAAAGPGPAPAAASAAPPCKALQRRYHPPPRAGCPAGTVLAISNRPENRTGWLSHDYSRSLPAQFVPSSPANGSAANCVPPTTLGDMEWIAARLNFLYTATQLPSYRPIKYQAGPGGYVAMDSAEGAKAACCSRAWPACTPLHARRTHTRAPGELPHPHSGRGGQPLPPAASHGPPCRIHSPRQASSQPKCAACVPARPRRRRRAALVLGQPSVRAPEAGTDGQGLCGHQRPPGAGVTPPLPPPRAAAPGRTAAWQELLPAAALFSRGAPALNPLVPHRQWNCPNYPGALTWRGSDMRAVLQRGRVGGG